MRLKSRIKALIKCILSKLLSKNVGEIKKKIDGSRIISFDVFDTLIERNVEKPEDIFELIKQEYCGQYGIEISSFREERIRAERLARKNAVREEVTLQEIYLAFEGLQEEQKNRLMNFEQEMEIKCCKAGEKGHELFEYAQLMNKRIIIISDMYLPTNTVKNILEKNGYKGYDRLFVSSEYGIMKRTGSLYRRMLTETGFSPKEVLHIGDNPVSDGIFAWRNKISACVLRK